VSYRVVFPFTALVGQAEMKKALLLNAVDPGIGGVLIRGEKGTAKSTATRALAALLPHIEVVADCVYSCDPHQPTRMCTGCYAEWMAGQPLPTVQRPVRLIELPLNATEDKVVGSLDFASAVKTGTATFAPGLLALANRGILYIDEVNLLNDHLVDAILDAAASGVNRVEREGISYTHPSRFVLIGSMNPEEGEIRPQLLDRFGLCVNVQGVHDAAARVRLVKLREAYDLDPRAFLAQFAKIEEKQRKVIQKAHQLLPSVTIADREQELIAEVVLNSRAAGHRADLVLDRSARAFAALSRAGQVSPVHIREVSHLALAHRALPPLPPEPRPQDSTRRRDRTPPSESSKDRQSQSKETDPAPGAGMEWDQPVDQPHYGSDRETVSAVGEVFRVRPIHSQSARRLLRQGSGRRSRALVTTKIGRYVRSTPQRRNNDLALDATLRAAAPYQRSRRAQGSRSGVQILIENRDIREKVRERRVGSLLLFIVDASGSMSAYHRMVATKGAIMSLLLDAYQKRDKLGLVAFRKSKATILLPPTNSIELARRLLEELPTGGKTPLADGLATGYELALTHLRKDPHTPPLLILVTDGRANVSLNGGDPWQEALEITQKISRNPNIHTLVIDTEDDRFTDLGMARELAFALRAPCNRLADLKAEDIVNLVQEARNSR
jgi:magnesium chelatase subunit D